MKKMILLCFVGILIISGIETVARPDSRDKGMGITVESIVVSTPNIKDTGLYLTIQLEESDSSVLEPGKPLLPCITKVFTFPFGTKICDVTVRYSETNELALPKEIMPVAVPSPGDALAVNEPVKDPIVYDSTAVYPDNPFDFTTGAGLDGVTRVVYLAVRCYPVRYSPANTLLYFSEHVEIQVTYEEPVAPSPFTDEYDLVIIAPSRFSRNLQPLIDHKLAMGVSTILKTTEEIYSEYNGFDDAEKIKYFIKDAIESLGVKYVLLIGGIGRLPIRTTWFFQRHHDRYWNETVLTDLYFADIYDSGGNFCSWDSNGNGLYGERYINCPGVSDFCDFYPDVHVGRLPCDRAAEVRTVVKKIINYETETAGKDWFKNIILVGGDTFPGWNGNEGEIKNLLTEEIMSDFSSIKLWTSDETFTARSLNSAINQGAGFIDYSGHGFEIGLGTHPPNSEAWVTYHTNNLLGAVNGHKLPIIFFDACLTAKLDFNFSEFIGYIYEDASVFVDVFRRIASLRIIPTFAWCMVRMRAGGAIATIGATRTAFGGIDSGAGYISLRFFEAYATSDTVAEMMTAAQNDYIAYVPSDRFTVQEFILIGDPSLKIGGY